MVTQVQFVLEVVLATCFCINTNGHVGCMCAGGKGGVSFCPNNSVCTVALEQTVIVQLIEDPNPWYSMYL